MVSICSQNQVVLLSILGEIFFCIVNHMISANRTRLVHIPGAANGCDLSAECFGNLHRIRPYTTRCALNQNFLPWLNLSLIAHALQGSDSRHGYRRSLLKG